MIWPHLPALQIALPMLCAPLCLLSGRYPRWPWLISLLVSWSCLVIAWYLLHATTQQGVLHYALGGWAAPWGIAYRIDALNALVLLVVSGIAAVVLPFAQKSVTQEVAKDCIGLFYCALLLCLTGLLGIVITGDVFNLFVFLEISSLSAYVLVSMGRDRRALTAAFQYLVMGTLGATFLLLGIGLLYMVTGTLNMQDLAERLPELHQNRGVQSAFAFLLVGISLKMALFPLHLWLPNAYCFAPATATAFLAATATKVAFYVLLRFTFEIFGHDFAFETLPLGPILITLALGAIFGGSIMAIFQQNLKRLFAYSSIAHIGFMVLGMALHSVTGLAAGILHLFNHALIKGALFLALGSVFYRLGTVQLNALQGLGLTMPWTSAALVIGGLSLIGLPLTAGFISKWVLLSAVLEQGRWWLVAAILFGSLLSVIYIWRLVETLYLATPTCPSTQHTSAKEVPWSLLAPTWTLILANLYFGLVPNINAGTAHKAALQLMGGP